MSTRISSSNTARPTPIRAGKWLLLTVAALMVVGCATERFSWRNALGLAEVNTAAADPSMSIAERVERLENLRDRADRLESAEQHQIATTLARSFATESEPAVRLAMVETFGYLDSPAAVQGLQAGLQDANQDIRIQACRSLGRIGSPAAMQLLIATHGSDTHTDVRIAAIRELGRFEEPNAVEALGKSLNDTDPAIQFVAMQSLQKATGERLGKDVGKWKRHLATQFPVTDSPVGVADLPETRR